MIQITGEAVQRFLQDEGRIGIVDPAGVIRMLHVALPEYNDLAETADRLWHDGSWYSREQFAQRFSKVAIEAAVGFSKVEIAASVAD